MELKLEEFTELIVKECVSIVAKLKDEAIDNEWNVDEAMSMAEIDIEEHFCITKYKKTVYDEISWRFDRETQ